MLTDPNYELLPKTLTSLQSPMPQPNQLCDIDAVLDALVELLSLNDPNDYLMESFCLIEQFLAEEFSYQDKCLSFNPKDLKQKAQNAFWSAFHLHIPEEQLNKIIEGPGFQEGGVIYRMAHADSLMLALSETPLLDN